MEYSFAVFADGCANLPKQMLEGIKLIPNEYTLDGVPQTYLGDVDHFDGHAFYQDLKNGKVAKTSLINTHTFETNFKPVLDEGIDIIYISMSSGISGTYNAARIAAEELMEEYKDRFIHIVDSHGCGFGNGLLAERAVKLAKEGVDVRKAAALLDEDVPHMCQYFTVDDLNFLKRTGRVSGVASAIGTVLNIKPILYGDSTGHIINCAKVRGRGASIKALVKYYEEKREQIADQHVCRSHGDCKEDAEFVRDEVKKRFGYENFMISDLSPTIGSHAGPGTVALFYLGRER